jgi:WD40 repeat protein
MRVLRGHSGLAVHGLAFAPDGSRLASIGRDGSLRLWDPDRGTNVRVGVCASLHGLAFAPDGRTLAASARSGLGLWPLPPGPVRWLDQGHVHASAPCYSPDGSMLAAWRFGLRVWGAHTGRLLTRRPPEAHCTALAFAPDGALAEACHHLTADRPGSRLHMERFIRLADPRPYRTRMILRGHVDHPESLAFRPDGTVLAAAAGRALHAWDVRTGRPLLRHAPGPGRHVFKGVAFTPDGRHLVAARGDGTVRLLETGTWAEAAVYNWDVGPLFSLAVAPDGMRAAVGGKGAIVVWDVDL